MARIETFYDYDEALDYLGGRWERNIGFETRVSRNHLADSLSVYHHGTEIVQFDKAGRVWFSLGGWGSKTTIERVDKILRRLRVPLRFGRHDWEPVVYAVPHTHDKHHRGELDPCEMYAVERGVTPDGEEVITLTPEHGRVLTFKL